MGYHRDGFLGRPDIGDRDKSVLFLDSGFADAGRLWHSDCRLLVVSDAPIRPTADVLGIDQSGIHNTAPTTGKLITC